MDKDKYGASKVNVFLVLTYGILVFVLLFIFIKRQIMHFAIKSRRGPHVPIGHNAPKELKQVIEAKLCEVQKIHYEPRLLSPADDRLTQRRQSGQSVQSLHISTATIRNHTTDRNVFCVFMFIGSDDYLYRMKALDAVRDTDFPFRELGGTPSAVTGKRFRTWLLQLQNSHSMFRDKQSSLIDTVLDGYNKARHGAEAFGEAEFIKYQEALTELAAIVKSRGSTLSHHHQTAARDLTGTTEPSSPSSCSSSPTQTTYLTSAAQQRSKRPRNFLELKNFKDNYNTLDSTL
ncbi:protein C1orf43 homolog isoform X1 [Poeciliopsis prolifica]|uniref:protein C1orf43 homolog isoform X1 n=1 Tax=Poeciliopsis prolifica TaxID=188132 RepID=UPI00241314FB|nr:protein C1orf43 homolog isoform X1 [Poeciliopsis prolifica]